MNKRRIHKLFGLMLCIWGYIATGLIAVLPYDNKYAVRARENLYGKGE